MRKSYYLDNGLYYDVTTDKIYVPKSYCEITGVNYGLTIHHKLSQNRCLNSLKSTKIRHPKTWTKEFIQENQKLFTLNIQVHADVHSMSDEHFYQKYGIERRNFIYTE